MLTNDKSLERALNWPFIDKANNKNSCVQVSLQTLGPTLKMLIILFV